MTEADNNNEWIVVPAAARLLWSIVFASMGSYLSVGSNSDPLGGGHVRTAPTKQHLTKNPKLVVVKPDMTRALTLVAVKVVAEELVAGEDSPQDTRVAVAK